MICPRCQGQKRGVAHINNGDKPHEWKMLDCGTCKGTGEVTEEQAKRIQRGEEYRNLRVNACLSLREFGSRADVPPSVVSWFEVGIDVAPETLEKLERAYAGLEAKP